eukprot:GEMP01133512.1.p1 GENE.GEMP01133512.1~~GEMP01133512.1.p1  ORF type:complete len:110 (-),score=2.18 GEMP01133512.1:179-484(-)
MVVHHSCIGSTLEIWEGRNLHTRTRLPKEFCCPESKRGHKNKNKGQKKRLSYPGFQVRCTCACQANNNSRDPKKKKMQYAIKKTNAGLPIAYNYSSMVLNI